MQCHTPSHITAVMFLGLDQVKVIVFWRSERCNFLAVHVDKDMQLSLNDRMWHNPSSDTRMTLVGHTLYLESHIFLVQNFSNSAILQEALITDEMLWFVWPSCSLIKLLLLLLLMWSQCYAITDGQRNYTIDGTLIISPSSLASHLFIPH